MRNEKKITLIKTQTLIKEKNHFNSQLQICNQNSEKLNIFLPALYFKIVYHFHTSFPIQKNLNILFSLPYILQPSNQYINVRNQQVIKKKYGSNQIIK